MKKIDTSLHTIRTTLNKEPVLIELQLSIDGLLFVLSWFNDDDMPKMTDLLFTGVSQLQLTVHTLDQHVVLSLDEYDPKSARVRLRLAEQEFADFCFSGVRARVS